MNNLARKQHGKRPDGVSRMKMRIILSFINVIKLAIV
jgi:hypothetical protein